MMGGPSCLRTGCTHGCCGERYAWRARGRVIAVCTDVGDRGCRMVQLHVDRELDHGQRMQAKYEVDCSAAVKKISF